MPTDPKGKIPPPIPTTSPLNAAYGNLMLMMLAAQTKTIPTDN